MRLALSSLVPLGRKTVTGMISASGGQFADWSADYRLFLKRRFDADAMFDVIRRNVVDQLDADAPLVVALDDALLRRSGKKVHGAGWRRDPLGPKFQTNLVWRKGPCRLRRRFHTAVFRNKPQDATLIGRIRKDAKLYHLPTQCAVGRGGKKSYGDRAPTPGQLRVDESVAWETATVFAGGEPRQMRVKTMAPVRWRSAGGGKDLRLVVIAPAGYRLRKGGKLLYGQPPHLICDDMEIPVEKLVQAYAWRWGIEGNFRDEKQIIGVGEAHVRKESSVESPPQFLVATYAIAQLAAMKAFGNESSAESLPLPRWRKDKPTPKQTTSGIISRLRVELWGMALGSGKFSGFARGGEKTAKGEKFVPDLASSVFYAMA